MAVFETSRALNEGVRADARGFVANLINLFIDWNDRRVTRNALAALSARELADIGLTRADLADM